MQKLLSYGDIILIISIYSLGYSNLSWETFRELIELPDLDCLVDVRSSPSSRWSQFRKHELRTRLNRLGVAYVFLGDQLGGHPANGPTDYEAIARTASFAAGIDRLLNIAERCRPAILCSEHEPLHCHRFLLIARHLVEQYEISVEYILRDGRIEPHGHAEDRLLALHGGTEDLFGDRREQLAHVYRWQALRLGVGR